MKRLMDAEKHTMFLPYATHVVMHIQLEFPSTWRAR